MAFTALGRGAQGPGARCIPAAASAYLCARDRVVYLLRSDTGSGVPCVLSGLYVYCRVNTTFLPLSACRVPQGGDALNVVSASSHCARGIRYYYITLASCRLERYLATFSTRFTAPSAAALATRLMRLARPGRASATWSELSRPAGELAPVDSYGDLLSHPPYVIDIPFPHLITDIVCS